ncbi:MAG: TVP38/TMEM64 family protein [Chloroflexota bacterium]|nr:TVP38/TMEM64 family protein [Chloroflexota bacterium]
MAIPSSPEIETTTISADISERRWLGSLQRAWPKLLGLVIWLALLGAYWYYVRVSGLTPLQTVQRLVEFLAGNPLGVLVYVLLYMLRPVLFFPATLLTLAAGYLYGPFYGIAIVIVASNLSAMVAYFIGRFFGAGIVDRSSGSGALQQYTERMRQNSFETVLILRFLFLPYDLVSYFSGFLRVEWKGFLLATALGSIPGTISFVMFGAAIEGGFTGELPRLNPGSLAVAAAMFVVSIGLSRWFKRREARREPLTSEGVS